MWSTAQASSDKSDPFGEDAVSASGKAFPKQPGDSRLIGRETELATLSGLLFDPSVRILTLTGPAGVGKSRIARAAARPELFSGGVTTVALHAAREAGTAWRKIAAALGLHPEPGRDTSLPEQIADRIGKSELLLLLDDCDLVAALISLDVAALSARCPGLRILLTSRVSLDIYDERLFPVRPFPVLSRGRVAAEGREAPAVRLFVERARAQRPNYVLSEEDVAVIRDVCARLDGLPLAIELSAGAVGMLGPRALLTQLEHGEWPASSRLTDLPPRHRTVAASLSWGDALISPELRRLLRQLTILEGQFDLATAQHLTELSRHQLMRHLESLIHMSLLERVERPNGDTGFRMLNMVRAYYLEHEQSEPEQLARVRARHAEYFAGLAEAAEADLRGPEQGQALPAVRRRLKDYRAALFHLQAHSDHVPAARMLLALDIALDDLRCLPEALERLLNSARHLEAAPDADRHRPLIARALETTAVWSLATGRAGADVMLLRACEVYQSLDDPAGAARVLGRLAEAERRDGGLDSAAAHADLAVTELDRLGERSAAATVRRTLALVTAVRDPAAAERLLLHALEDQSSGGAGRDRAITLTDLARVRADDGRPAEAYAAVREAMDLLRETGGPRHVVRALETAARVLPQVNEGQRHRSARLLLTTHAVRERYGLPESEDAPALRMALEQLRGTLGESTLTVLRRQARVTTPLAALNDALSAPPSTLRASTPHEESDVLAALTPRQAEIARMAANGLTNRQIARALGLSEWTVINHLRQVMQKLKCPSRVHVARLVQQATVQL